MNNDSFTPEHRAHDLAMLCTYFEISYRHREKPEPIVPDEFLVTYDENYKNFRKFLSHSH